MNAGMEFLGWSVIFALGLIWWLGYELRQFHRRYTRRHTLRAPVKRCVSDSLNEAWLGRKS